MKKNKPRNHVALNPLLRKGGAHVRAKSGERFANRQKMLKAAREWKSSRDFCVECGGAPNAVLWPTRQGPDIYPALLVQFK
ncbi:hypothetical protein FHS09_001239 [Microbulbifer rhizosphaerae]|uniref:Uncharacterized protein n=1 Tax=Microbulbifer rhizosphaerae TaxID=1562603 RepID=A0A7W4WA46_9GAMM|nr:hypothetical protein [Microbulbifer rhizosphaerae]